MQIILILIAIFFFRDVGGNQVPTNAWNGLVPLSSTRRDVENLLGTSSHKCKCVYQTEKEVIYITYAVSQCKGDLPGWDVPPDTVLKFTINPVNGNTVEGLGLDLSEFVKIAGHGGKVYFTNEKSGIQYTVNLTDNSVEATTYMPTKSDLRLRCKGFPSFDPISLTYYPSDKYETLGDIKKDASRLDNFALQLSGIPNYVGYIFIYTGPGDSNKKIATYLQNVNNHMFKKLGLNRKHVNIIRGGNRGKFEVEMYILPSTYPPPTATPTIASTSR